MSIIDIIIVLQSFSPTLLKNYLEGIHGMKKALSFILILSLLLVLSACGGVSQYEKQVLNNQYADALETYEKSIKGDAAKEAEAAEFLKQYLSESWQGYLDETISKSDFDARFETITEIGAILNEPGLGLEEVKAAYPDVVASKKAYQDGIAQMESGDYEAAMASFTQVDSLDGKNYSDAQERYEEAKALYYDSVLSSVQEKLDAKDFDGAKELIRAAENTVGNDSRFDEMTIRIVTAEYESEMSKYAAENDFASLKKIYDSAMEDPSCRVSSEMTELFAEKQQQFRQDIIDRSISAYKETGYAAAIEVIGEGLAVLQDDEQLLKYNELYSSCAPVSLGDLKETDRETGFSTAIYFVSILKTAETSFSDVYWYNPVEGHPVSQSFSLDGTFSEFTASVFVLTMSDTDSWFDLKIYGDDTLLYDSGMMDEKTECTELKLDVSNINTLRFVSETNDTKIPSSIMQGRGVVVCTGLFTRTLTDSDLQG